MGCHERSNELCTPCDMDNKELVPCHRINVYDSNSGTRGLLNILRVSKKMSPEKKGNLEDLKNFMMLCHPRDWDHVHVWSVLQRKVKPRRNPSRNITFFKQTPVLPLPST